jgi:hypothetical protein
MVDSDRELIPNALEVNPHGFWPTPILHPKPVGPKTDPFVDEDFADAAGPSS